MTRILRFLLILIFTKVISACNLPLNPTIIEAPVNPSPIITQPPQVTEQGDGRPCGFQWAYRDNPELSREIERALKDAGLTNAKARAEAYGENCIDENGEAVYFTTKETDFHITLKVKDLDDLDGLGQLLDTTLAVLDEFPPEETPGPQPGYIGIVFEARGDEIRLWIMLSQIIQLRQDGLNGAELLQALMNP